MGALTREQLLSTKATQRPMERVEIPELGPGAYVNVIGLTVKEAGDFRASVMVGKGAKRRLNFREYGIRLAARTLVDDQGNRIFSDAPADLDKLGQLRSDIIERIVDVAQRLSGFSEKEEDDLEPSSASGSPSASSST